MLQNFLKVYPKMMSAQMSGEALVVKLAYTVEQYGVLTGPFEMVVHYQADGQAQDEARWAIVSNTNQRGKGGFESLFKTLEMYLKGMAQGNPLEEVRSGVKHSFEMYFPKMHCDLYPSSNGAERSTLPRACANRLGGAGLKRAVDSLVRLGGFKPALGMA